MTMEVTLGQILAGLIPVIALGLMAWGLRKWAERTEGDNAKTADGVIALHEKVDGIDQKIDDHRLETVNLMNAKAEIIHKRISEVDTKVEKIKERVNIHHPRRGGE